MKPEPLTLYYCDKHKEWYSNNCSDCMANDNEPLIRADERAKVLKEVGEYINTHEMNGKIIQQLLRSQKPGDKP